MKYILILGIGLKTIRLKNLNVKRPILVVLLFLIVLNGACSTDDSLDEGTDTSIPDITILGRTTEAIIQANIVAGNSITNINLTQQLGIHPAGRMMPVSKKSSLVGYYRFPQGSYGDYSVWEKDIDSERIAEYATPCGLVSNEPYFFPKVFEDIITIFSTSEGPNNSTLLRLNIFNKNSGTCSQVSLGETSSIQRPFRIMKGNLILTYHVNPDQESILTKINASTGMIEDELIHNGPISAVIQENTIHVYLQTSNLQHLTYNFNSFGFNGVSTASNSLFLETGLFETSFKANEMLINLPYLQPSQFAVGPALLNLDSGEFSRILEMQTIKSNLDAFLETDEQIVLSDFYEVSLDQDLLIGGYYIGDGNSLGSYGIYYTKLDGTMLQNLELDFEPEKIIIK